MTHGEYYYYYYYYYWHIWPVKSILSLHMSFLINLAIKKAKWSNLLYTHLLDWPRQPDYFSNKSVCPKSTLLYFYAAVE